MTKYGDRVMAQSKHTPALGFDLSELASQVEHDQSPPQPPVDSREPRVRAGRPRRLAEDTQPFSVRLSPAQREWLIKQAALQTLSSGERHDASGVLRALIDQARERRT